MILTEYVIYRGKKKKVSELSHTSAYKVKVKCPVCENVRDAYYRVICQAGHFLCLRCIRKKNQSKTLNVGEVFGMLKIVSQSCKTGYSICKCECGEQIEVQNHSLHTGRTKSCGCLKKENFKNVNRAVGDKHGNWKGGISGLRERDMQTSRYKNWRTCVFERDKYTCVKCGQIGSTLNAHHINNYHSHENGRLDISNGITFCKNCHINFHKLYGRKNNNSLQINEYLSE